MNEILEIDGKRYIELGPRIPFLLPSTNPELYKGFAFVIGEEVTIHQTYLISLPFHQPSIAALSSNPKVVEIPQALLADFIPEKMKYVNGVFLPQSA